MSGSAPRGSLACLQVTTDSHSLPLTLRWGFVSGISHARRRGDLCLNILNTSPLKTIVTPDRGSAHFRSKFEACLLDTMLNFQLAFEDMRCANLHLVRLAQRLGDLCLSLAGSFDVLI